MARKDYSALTLEQFVALTIERNTPSYGNKVDADRYELRHVHNWHYADSAESDAWYDICPTRNNFDDTDDGFRAYQSARDAWKELEPARVNTDTYTLESSTSLYRVVTISKELYDLFDNVWSKRSRFKGARPERVGQLTLTGLLRRLDKTASNDVLTQIQSARDARQERQTKIVCNQQRAHIAKALTDLESALLGAAALQDNATVRDFITENLPALSALRNAVAFEQVD